MSRISHPHWGTLIGWLVAMTMADLPAIATTFEVPICANTSLTADSPFYYALDLGTSLLSVQSVDLRFDAVMTAGLASDGTPLGSGFVASLKGDASRWWAVTPRVGVTTWPSPEPLVGIKRFTKLDGDWAFLLDGTAAGYLEINSVVTIPEEPPVMMQPAGFLNRVSLVIQATPVPEPAIAGWLLAGVTLLASRRGAVDPPHRNPPRTL